MSEQPKGQRPRERRRFRRETVVGRVEDDRGVFMISVAAELADMHPQTLRMYEAKGLITPKRSAKNTRLYSQGDVERLRRIQRLTSEEGLNLAGVVSVLELEDKLEQMRADLDRFRRRAEELEQEMEQEIERARRSLGGEIVPYGMYDVLGPAEDANGEGKEDRTTKPERPAAEPERPAARSERTATSPERPQAVRVPIQRRGKRR